MQTPHQMRASNSCCPLSTRISTIKVVHYICLHLHQNIEGAHNSWETWEESCWIVRPQQKRLLFEVKPSLKNLQTRVQEFSRRDWVRLSVTRLDNENVKLACG